VDQVGLGWGGTERGEREVVIVVVVVVVVVLLEGHPGFSWPFGIIETHND
jgi:hypothetical protein